MENNENYEQLFIAYKGAYDKDRKIQKRMRFFLGERLSNSRDYTIKYESDCFGDSMIEFAKIIPKRLYGEPRVEIPEHTITVSGYRPDEAFGNTMKALEDFSFNVSGSYLQHKSSVFRELSNLHFCSVFWDPQKDAIVAGVTEPDCEYAHLYYGYMGDGNDFIFSNYEDVLKDFCIEVYEMPKNTYMENGKFYTLDGKEIPRQEVEKEHYSKQALDPFSDDIHQEVKKQAEQCLQDYLSSIDKREELNQEIKKQILEATKKVIEEYNMEEYIGSQLEDKLNEKAAEYTSQMQLPVVHIVKLNDTVLGQTKGGFYHEKFEQILRQVQIDSPIMLIGPAGSGKNVAVSQVADALGLHMYYTNNASNEFKLTGFIDASGTYRDTEFYKAFKYGGVFFLDEIDCSDPSSLIVINSALANGYMAFPHETIDRHPNFRMIAAANTWGKGADLQYVGRNPLDAATLDRFDNIFFDYDQNLERSLYPNDEVLQFMWAFRNAVYQSRVSHIVSTRGIGAVYKKEMNGIPVQDILTSNVIKNLGQDDINTIIGNMKDIDENNKYYEGITQYGSNKQLRLIS